MLQDDPQTLQLICPLNLSHLSLYMVSAPRIFFYSLVNGDIAGTWATLPRPVASARVEPSEMEVN